VEAKVKKFDQIRLHAKNFNKSSLKKSNQVLDMWDKVSYNVGQCGTKWGKMGIRTIVLSLKWEKLPHRLQR